MSFCPKVVTKLCLAGSVCAGAFIAAAADGPSKAPTEWMPVHTNLINQWKTAFKAPSGVVADRTARKVRFLVEATGVRTNDIVEFFAIGPLSDRAYESYFVTVSSPAALADAVASIGVPLGVPVDPFDARLWPEGEKLTLTAEPYPPMADAAARPLDGVLTDTQVKTGGAILREPLVWTGGSRDAVGAVIAATNIPCPVFALYSQGLSLLQFNGAFDQSAIYGRFRPAASYPAGALFTITLTWDGRTTVADRTLRVSPENAAAVIASLRRDALSHDVFARLVFDSSVTVAQAAKIAGAFDLLDGQGVKMNGRAPGQFFYRSFLPDPAWRARTGRVFQPFEVHVTQDGKKSFTFVEEDWSGDGLDPVLKPRTTPFTDWHALPGLIAKTGTQGEKVVVLFIFAPLSTPVASLAPVLEAVSPRVNTFYVFGE